MVSASPGGQHLQVSNFGDMEPVLFNHGRHAEQYECVGCHHPGRSEGAHRCGACHRGKAEGSVMKIEDAAHEQRVGKCWACHFGPLAKKPLDCDDCHRGSP